MARSQLDTVPRIPHDPHRWDRAPSMHDLKPADVAQTFMSFAGCRNTAVSAPASIIERLCEHALKIVDKFQPADIAALFRAMATLRLNPEPTLLMALSERAKYCAKGFSPEHVADLLWSFPNLGLKVDRELFAAISHKINLSRHRYLGKTAVNTLWAVARMKLCREIGLIHALVQQIQERPDLLAPMDVGMALWVSSPDHRPSDVEQALDMPCCCAELRRPGGARIDGEHYSRACRHVYRARKRVWAHGLGKPVEEHGIVRVFPFLAAAERYELPRFHDRRHISG